MGNVVSLSTSPRFAADRNALFAALRHRVEPHSAPSVVVVFGFVGLNEYAKLASDKACVSLVDWFGSCIAKVVGEAGEVFHARRNEYFVIIDGTGDSARELVTRTRTELDRVGQPCNVRACFGFALLPGEARFPTQALAVADERLRAMVGDLRPDPH